MKMLFKIMTLSEILGLGSINRKKREKRSRGPHSSGAFQCLVWGCEEESAEENEKEQPLRAVTVVSRKPRAVVFQEKGSNRLYDMLLVS